MSVGATDSGVNKMGTTVSGGINGGVTPALPGLALFPSGVISGGVEPSGGISVFVEVGRGGSGVSVVEFPLDGLSVGDAGGSVDSGVGALVEVERGGELGVTIGVGGGGGVGCTVGDGAEVWVNTSVGGTGLSVFPS